MPDKAQVPSSAMKPSISHGALAAITLWSAISPAAQAAPDITGAQVIARTVANGAEPSLKSGSILTPDVNIAVAPGEAEIALQLDSGTIGLSQVEVEILSPSGLHNVTGGYYLPQYPPPPRKQSIDIDVGGFDIYGESGAWSVVEVTLGSADGKTITYSGSKLAGLFPSLVVNVANANQADITPPTFGRGKILTPTVSLSAAAPYFAANLAVTDNLSGVASLSLGIGVPNYGDITANATPAASLLNGKLVPAVSFSPENSPTGTYTIVYITICDAAGNCQTDSNAADIQRAFGTTTFQVTN
jgi:hypothetical protein